MNDKEKTGIIIQARYSSTRLPGKLFLPFYKSKKLIEIFLDNIVKYVNGKYEIVLATSSNKQDDVFEEVVSGYGINIFRGDEADVLQRMIDAAKEFGFATVIRVCADNPVYDIENTLNLLDAHRISGSDYTAYCLEGKIPSIKTHLGLWGEVVELKSLIKAANITNDGYYHEHVTNYLYENPDIFKINLINAPDLVFNRKDIRLTVDQVEDFEIMRQIYSEYFIKYTNFDLNGLISLIDNNPEILKKMKVQIEKNKK